MSDKEVRPYHARDVSSGQETADAVADVLKHAAERDEAAQRKVAPKPQPKWMLPLALNLGLLAAYFLAFQPEWTDLNAIQPPPAEERVDNLKTSMYLGISRIETFLINNNRLPASLEEAGAVALVGVADYQVRGDSSYVLIANIGEQVISYDSRTQTPQEFRGPFTLPG